MVANQPRTSLWIGIAAVAAVAVALLVLFLSRRQDASAGTAAGAPAASATEYANDRIRREIDEQGLTVDRARQLFALEVAPLPGVTVPDGPVRETISGTYALMQLMAVRDQLSPAQQARLRALLKPTPSRPSRPAPDAPALPPPFALPGVAPALFFESDRPSFTRIRFADDDPPADSDDPDVTPAERAYFRELYNWASEAVSKLTIQPQVPFFWIEFRKLDAPETKKAWALSTAWNDNTLQRLQDRSQGITLNVCQSIVDRRKFKGLPLSVHLSVVVHEVVHCYQQLAAPTQSAAATPKGWLIDGEATWAQMVIVPNAAFPALQDHWAEYLTAPKTHLFARKYDAAGFFGHVQDVIGVGTVGKRLIPAILAGAGGASEAAFDIVVAGSEDPVLDTWASSYFRTHESQPLWTVKGPGSVNFPSEKVAPLELAVAEGASVDLPQTAPWELSLVSLNSSADVLIIGNTTGHLALIDSTEGANATLLPMETTNLCLRESCACPAGTQGTPPSTINARPKIDIGLTGGKTGASGWAMGKSLKDFCEQVPKPVPPPRDSQTPTARDTREPGNGRASSDPHIVTFDGRWYDLQAVGEFVLAQSTVDNFTVQARFAPLPSVHTVSIVTAVAARVGRDRVTVTLLPGNARPTARINGQLLDTNFVVLDGGSVRTVTTEWGPGYTIELNDGTRVGVSPFVRHSLNTWVTPADARQGKLAGLLGDFDDNPDFEPTARNSREPLPVAPSYDDLYTTFGGSWRITAGESLFDYGAGETTATFTDLTFPDRLTPIADAATITAAESSCRDGGITDPNLLRNCTTDVAATGDFAYVRAYRPQQARATYAAARGMPTRRPPATPPAPAPPAASGRTKSTVLEGRVTDASADAFASFAGFRGDVIYLNPGDNCVQPRSARLLAPGGKTLGGLTFPCGTRVVLPIDGTYRFAFNPFHDFAGPYRLPLVAVRPDRVTHITQGDALTGALAARAEQDVFVFEVKAPGTIDIGGDGCDAGFDAAVYFGMGDDELVGAGPACRL
ncbi:MAG: VWD domain-containing protein, partial [Acidobacteriota bacterium]